MEETILVRPTPDLNTTPLKEIELKDKVVVTCSIMEEERGDNSHHNGSNNNINKSDMNEKKEQQLREDDDDEEDGENSSSLRANLTTTPPLASAVSASGGGGEEEEEEDHYQHPQQQLNQQQQQEDGSSTRSFKSTFSSLRSLLSAFERGEEDEEQQQQPAGSWTLRSRPPFRPSLSSRRRKSRRNSSTSSLIGGEFEDTTMRTTNVITTRTGNTTTNTSSTANDEEIGGSCGGKLQQEDNDGAIMLLGERSKSVSFKIRTTGAGEADDDEHLQEEQPMLRQQRSFNESDDEEEPSHTFELSSSLTENSYSIIYVANPHDRAFYVGIIIFFFQASLPILALLNLTDLHKDNFLAVPVDVDNTVHAAGFITLILSVPYFPDLLDSIERFHQGYDPIVLKQCKYATFNKWFLSLFLQFLSGLLFNLVIFVLVVQSTTVIMMLLNFAALAFITEIDDVAFSLEDRGYFSKSMKKACNVVKKLKTPNTKGPWLRRFALIFFISLLVVGYSVVYDMQTKAMFSCNRIEVQFGDGYWTRLPLYSGVYYIDENKSKRKRDDRLVYLDEVSNGQVSVFRYCQDYEAWVFGLFHSTRHGKESIEVLDEDYDKICKPGNWISKSPDTTTFDLLEKRPTDWTVHKNTEQNNELTYPVDHMFMRCLDCNTQTCNSIGGSCETDANGNSYCKCKPGFFGTNCQYDSNEACDYIEYDRRYDPFPVPVPTRFELAKKDNGTIYDFNGKTVYTYIYPEEVTKAFYVLAYYGRRYLLLLTTYGNTNGPFQNSTGGTILGDFMEFIKYDRANGFRFGIPNADLLFVSEPLDVGSPIDHFTPTGISWFKPTINDLGMALAIGPPVETRLLCSNCNPSGGVHCELNGQCDSLEAVGGDGGPGQCICEKDIITAGDGYIGPLCEAYVENITKWEESH